MTSAEFEELTDVIAEELLARIAIGDLGDIHPSEGDIRKLAALVADGVVSVYEVKRLEAAPDSN